jgi:hypothetical protein
MISKRARLAKKGPVPGRRSIQAGMVVRSADGSRLGVVTACSNAHFYLRKGCINAEKYAAPYAEIAGVRGGDLILRRGLESLIELSKAGVEGPLTHTKPMLSIPAV